jgi:hypothetical protein
MSSTGFFSWGGVLEQEELHHLRRVFPSGKAIHLTRSASRSLTRGAIVPVYAGSRLGPPKFAHKLSQRSKARLVVWSVHGGYLRVFEEPMELWKARRLVTRYLKATNRGFLEKKCAHEPQNAAEG